MFKYRFNVCLSLVSCLVIHEEATLIIPVGWSKACHFCKPKTLHSESFSFESAAYLHGGIHIVHRVELGIQEATCYLWDHGQMTNHWKKSRVTTDIVGLGCGQCRQQRPEKKQSPKQKGFKCKKKRTVAFSTTIVGVWGYANSVNFER